MNDPSGLSVERSPGLEPTEPIGAEDTIGEVPSDEAARLEERLGAVMCQAAMSWFSGGEGVALNTPRLGVEETAGGFGLGMAMGDTGVRGVESMDIGLSG